jgi:hypothetical protein
MTGSCGEVTLLPVRLPDLTQVQDIPTGSHDERIARRIRATTGSASPVAFVRRRINALFNG